MPGYDLILYFECGCTEHRHETSCPIQEHFQFEVTHNLTRDSSPQSRPLFIPLNPDMRQAALLRNISGLTPVGGPSAEAAVSSRLTVEINRRD